MVLTNFYLQGPEVRSGDVSQPILLKEGQTFNFTINRGVSTQDTVSVNYDDFVNDVEVGDVLLVDGECLCYSACIWIFEINLHYVFIIKYFRLIYFREHFFF